MSTRKRMPFSERLRQVAGLLNQTGAVDVSDLVLQLEISPNYARQLLRWAAQKYPYAAWDEQKGVLTITERQPEPGKKAKAK